MSLGQSPAPKGKRGYGHYRHAGLCGGCQLIGIKGVVVFLVIFLATQVSEGMGVGPGTRLHKDGPVKKLCNQGVHPRGDRGRAENVLPPGSKLRV